MINLLPPREKKEWQVRQNQRFISILGFLILLFFISLISGLLVVNFHVSGQNVYQQALTNIIRQGLAIKESQAAKMEILELNKDIALISSFYQQRRYLTGTLEKIVLALPPGLSLKSISFQKDASSLTLTGFAETREDLVLFRNNIAAEPFFQEAFFPPLNWVKEKEIDFFVNITLSK
jgi:Tfp pilus assembly protein PilN